MSITISVSLGRDRATMLVEDDNWETAGLEAIRDILTRRDDPAADHADLTTYRNGWTLQPDGYHATIVVPTRPRPSLEKPGDWRVLGFARLVIEEEEL